MTDHYDDEDEYPDDDVLDDDDEYVTIRVGRGGARRWLLAAAGLLAVLVLVAGLVGLWVQRQIDPPGSAGEAIEIEIPDGATSDDIGELLEDADVISSAFIWRWYLRFNDGGPFQAGLYDLPLNSAMGDVIGLLEAGPRPPEFDRFTVPEAFTVTEIVARLADAELGVAGFSEERLRELLASGAITSRSGPPDGGSMEGLLFPDTYEVEPDTTEQAVLQRMADQLDRVLDELDADTRAAELGLSRHELVIVASLIEEEAKVPADRTKIARVIYNRLEQGIPLGIDATSRYEAEISGRDRGDLDFDSDSPYNTRRIAGLPPTPIAAPGRGAIEAALQPEPGPWIFYVLADEAGNHFFTESAQEFQRAKAECAAKDLGCG